MKEQDNVGKNIQEELSVIWPEPLRELHEDFRVRAQVEHVNRGLLPVWERRIEFHG